MQFPVNVYYNSELKVTKPINVSTIDSLYDGIRDTIVYSMTQSVPRNAKYEKAIVIKKGMIFGTTEVIIDKLTEDDFKNVERIDVYLSTPTVGGRKSRRRKTRKNKRV